MQFDALGNHVMKNRLPRIRSSQALPHCIEFSRAEWRVRACVRACVELAETCMRSRRKLLTFFNYSLVGNVDSLIINRLRHKYREIETFSTEHK